MNYPKSLDGKVALVVGGSGAVEAPRHAACLSLGGCNRRPDRQASPESAPQRSQAAS